MPYEIKDASYEEYQKFCKLQGLRPVARDEYTFSFWLEFCKENRISNAVNDENGVPWKTRWGVR